MITSGNSSSTVLIVDDDPNVLRAYERRLRRRFAVETALCSEEGLTAANFLGPFAVIVSDMTMPRHSGAEFLEQMLTAFPDTVRIMLTGNADQRTAVEAINRAHVYRFLNKPCEADILEQAITEGIEEHQRLLGERELLGSAIVGAVRALSRALALARPGAAERAERVRRYASLLLDASGWPEAQGAPAGWEVKAAASLSTLGALTAPDDQTEAPPGSARVAAELIGQIPRLGTVAAIVASLDAGPLAPPAEVAESVTLGGAFLRMARELAKRIDAGAPFAGAAAALADARNDYPPPVLEALRAAVERNERRVVAEVAVQDLAEGMQLVNDVSAADGALLLAKGQDLTAAVRAILRDYAASNRIGGRIRVLAPLELVPTG